MDSGNYTCKAKNTAGLKTDTGSVEVIGELLITSLFRLVSVSMVVFVFYTLYDNFIRFMFIILCQFSPFCNGSLHFVLIFPFCNDGLHLVPVYHFCDDGLYLVPVLPICNGSLHFIVPVIPVFDDGLHLVPVFPVQCQVASFRMMIIKIIYLSGVNKPVDLLNKEYI